MRVEESAAVIEEEIMFWLTLKRANTTSILTAVIVPHVVTAWLDVEERDATYDVGVRKFFHALFFLRTVSEVCISSS